MYNFTFAGITNKYLPPVVLISCLQSFIHITASKHVVIKNVIFQQCELDQYYVYETNLMLTECWSCKVRNVTFLQYGLIAYNLLGRSWLSNIAINLTNTRSNTFLHYHGIFLTFKDLSDISYSHHLIVLNLISVYSQDSDFPSIDVETVVIDLQQTIFDVTIILNNSHFHNLKQKALLINAVASDVITTFNFILIENCIFEKITTKGLDIMIFIIFEGFNKILNISNCTFRNNENFEYLIGMNDIEIAHTPVYNTSNMKPNTLSIKAGIALNNKCGFLVVENMKYLPQYKTNIFILGPLKIAGATAFRSDLVTALYYFSEVNAYVMGPVTITKIYDLTIMHFITSEVTFGGDIIINSSICDQVIQLQSNFVYLKLEQNSTITIFNILIQNEIIAVDNDQYNNPYPYCIFQFISSQNIYTNTTPLISPANYRINFDRVFIINAKEKEKCEVSFYHYMSHCQWINSSVFHGYNPTIINEQIVQHKSNQMNEHTTICFCSNNVTDCSLDVLGQVYPGQTLQVELCVPCSSKDATLHVETHHRSLPTSACKIAHQNQLINFLTPHTSILNFTIVSNVTETCELFLTVSPFLYRIYEAFYVRLQPCPIGFVLQNGICDCDPVLISNKFVHIETCEIDQLTIKRPPNSWIVPLTSDNSTYSLCSNCPMDYCLQHSSDLNLQYPDTQCQFNRTGILCSQCQHSLSMVFGSSRCIPCTNIHALISIAILFAGMSLVVTLYLLNLTVTNGTIIGVIFYANIISINDSIFLANDNIFAPLRVFISFVNLDLGIETCFYNGMDGYTKMFLRLFFPLYVITIATSIIAISHYSSWVLRWTYTKSFPVLATLLLLSYSDALRTVFTVLFSYSVITEMPSGEQSFLWSFDASVKVFGLKFTILFITCLLMLLLLISFNILLLFAPQMSKFSLMKHFKPLLDAFQGSFKQKYYYWIGMSVIFRGVFLVLQTVPINCKMKMIMSTACVITFSLLFATLRPYKNKFVNIQELLLLLNLSIMYVVSYQGDSNRFSIITNAMVSLALLQFCMIILYHLLSFMCNILGIIQTTKHKLMGLKQKPSFFTW